MRRYVLAAIFCLTAMPALSQQTLLQGGPTTSGHAPEYTQSGNGQPVVMDSGPASGGGPGIGLSELNITSRGPGIGPYSNSGTGPLATHGCFFDNQTASANYHYMCFDPNAQGGGLIAFGAAGSASPLPLKFSINGQIIPFPAPNPGPNTYNSIVYANAYGMKCDGSTNDFNAWSAAYSAAVAIGSAELRLPAGNCFFGSNTLLITASNIHMTGSGLGATMITGTGNPILQIGSPTVIAINPILEHFTVKGIGTNPSNSSICIDFNDFNYGVARDVDAENCGIGWRATSTNASPGSISIGLTLDDILSSSVTATMLQLANAAGVHVVSPQFGRNGGDAYTNPCMVTITGLANGNSIDGGDIIPQGPNAATGTTVICYQGSTNADNELWLNHINTENYLNVISSDANTPEIGGLIINGERFGGNNGSSFFALNAATTLRSFHLTGGTESSSITIPSTAKVSISSITGTQISGLVSIAGNSNVDGAGTASDFSFVGGVANGGVALSGTFSKIQIRPNNLYTFSDTSLCASAVFAKCKDYYFSGSWTPGLTLCSSFPSSCAATGWAFAGSSGLYTIDGDEVFADGNLTVSTKGSATGPIYMTGFPWAWANAYGGCMIASYNNLASITGPILVGPVASSTAAQLFIGDLSGGVGVLNFSNSNISVNGEITVACRGKMQ